MRKKRSIHFIVNPHAGICKKDAVLSWATTLLNPSLYNVQVHLTATIEAFEEIMETIKQDTDAVVIAVGGDGTVNRLINAIADTNLTMGIVPMGSGNGLARELKIPLQPRKAIEMLNTAKPQMIDLLKVNNLYAGNVAGVGFDALIAHRFSHLKKRGFWAYAKLIFKELKSYNSQEYILRVDGKSIQKTAFMMSFANSRQFGNNAYIAPKASLTDGRFDIVILTKKRFLTMPKLLFDLFTKRFDKNKLVESFQAKEVVLENQNMLLHIDGDTVDLETPVRISIVPQKLSILVPQNKLLK